MSYRLTREKFERYAAKQPSGWRADALTAAEMAGDYVTLSREQMEALRLKYRPDRRASAAAPSPEPTVAELATNAGFAAWRAAAAIVNGERLLVTEAEYRTRSAVCEPCEFWDGSARAGLGKCSAPGCGCTKLKRWLATERCGRWL